MNIKEKNYWLRHRLQPVVLFFNVHGKTEEILASAGKSRNATRYVVRTQYRKANLEVVKRWPTISICLYGSVFSMVKTKIRSKLSREQYAEELFIRATKQEENGQLRSAFRLYLAAAKAGDTSCQVNVGNFYDAGTGVRRNRLAALYWYKRAYRRGVSCAASNIGVMWRNDKNPKRALEWFQKAARLGDEEPNLEIAKYYLPNQPNTPKPIR